MRALPLIASLLLAAGSSPAQDKKAPPETPLAAASGVVEKADKDALTFKPRGTDGKFEKAQTLVLTGTSKISILAPQKRGDKVVLTQREAEAKDLVAGQSIAVIFAEAGKDGPVLLSAVVHLTPAK